MPAQKPQSTQAAIRSLPLSPRPRKAGAQGTPDPRIDAAAAEVERIRAELIVSKIVAHASPQALIAALMKHVDNERREPATPGASSASARGG